MPRSSHIVLMMILLLLCSAAVSAQSQCCTSNTPPEAVDDEVSVSEGTTSAIFNVLANDIDEDGDTLSFVSIFTQATHGTLTNLGSGKLRYNHNGSETTTDFFSYRVTDGLATSTGFVNVFITPVNDAPDAVDDGAAVNEGGSIHVAILSNDTDVENHALTAGIATQPVHGSASVNGQGGITYTHHGSETTSDSFTYAINDGNGGTDTATVTITVTPVNDNPNAQEDTATVDEGSSIEIAVLNNDSDAENNSLTPVITSTPVNGTAVVNGNGTITYTHHGSETTNDAFMYTVNDGQGGADTAIVTIIVNAVNDAPVAQDDAATVDGVSSVTLVVLDNDSDAEGDSLSVAIDTMPSKGNAMVNPNNTITYHHSGNTAGTDTFSYVVVDGNGGVDTALVTITISNVNHLPVAQDDVATVTSNSSVNIVVLANDTDQDGNTLTAAIHVNPMHGTATVNANNTITYTHNGDTATSDNFVYNISDGMGGDDTATVTINIVPAGSNQPPAAQDDTATVNAGNSVTVIVLSNDTDADGNPLSVSITEQPAHGTATVNPNNNVIYTHDSSNTTSDSFVYTVNDGQGGTDTAQVTITVVPTGGNHAPVANDDTATVDEGAMVNIPVLINDTDADGHALTVSITTQPTNGSATINPNNVVSYTHNGSETTSDSFTYTVNDGNGGTDTGLVTITIHPVDEKHELVLNGGFEDVGSSAALAANWNINSKLAKDRRVCNTATKTFTSFGNCALQLKSSVATTRSVKQLIDVSSLLPDQPLVLSFEARAKLRFGAGTVMLKVFYPNNPKPTVLKVKPGKQTTGWQRFIDMLTVNGTPERVIVMVKVNNGVGTLLLDEISVSQ